jgi:hypothetical protein
MIVLVLCQGTFSQLAEKLDSLKGHSFTACGKTRFFEGAQLHSLRKNSIL